MFEILTSPWLIVGIIIAFLISNLATVRYLSNRNFKSYQRRNDDLNKLIELDKKHSKAAQKKGGNNHPAPK